MMTVGMLWHSAGTVEDRVKEAGDYYTDKYGRKPTEVHLNPKELPEERQIGSFRAVPDKYTLPGYLWIGVG